MSEILLTVLFICSVLVVIISIPSDTRGFKLKINSIIKPTSPRPPQPPVPPKE